MLTESLTCALVLMTGLKTAMQMTWQRCTFFHGSPFLRCDNIVRTVGRVRLAGSVYMAPLSLPLQSLS